MLLRQRIKAVADAVELLNLVQDRTRMHGVRRFPERLRREKNFRSVDLIQGI
jgi:hypothetical protein